MDELSGKKFTTGGVRRVLAPRENYRPTPKPVLSWRAAETTEFGVLNLP